MFRNIEQLVQLVKGTGSDDETDGDDITLSKAEANN